jgi:light-regulated signal transduction histidine kinase (bacteriophytochrome)
LLSFARQRKPQKEQVDICKVLDETMALRDYDLKVNDIKVERDIESTIPAVTADPHQLEQVFLNIINNGVDAMLDSGRVGILKVRAQASGSASATALSRNTEEIFPRAISKVAEPSSKSVSPRTTTSALRNPAYPHLRELRSSRAASFWLRTKRPSSNSSATSWPALVPRSQPS